MGGTPIMQIVLWLQNALLLGLGFAAFYHGLQLIPVRQRRVVFRQPGAPEPDRLPPASLLKVFGIRGDSDSMEEKRQLLAGAGIRLPVLRFELLRRAGLVLMLAAGLWGYAGRSHPVLLLYFPSLYWMLAAFLGAAALLADKPVLEALVRQRSYRIVKEIYAVSNQLLYYNGSRMNLHGKLTRCLPYTRILRNDLRQLLNDWYQDADQALRTFKDRLGTDDGAGFAETLQSMRLHEHEAFYELLKQRIQDFKDKLDLIKEGKKETTSYLLFVLAGLPILNTFRIFIYPWVQEGQKLFQQLN